MGVEAVKITSPFNRSRFVFIGGLSKTRFSIDTNTNPTNVSLKSTPELGFIKEEPSLIEATCLDTGNKEYLDFNIAPSTNGFLMDGDCAYLKSSDVKFDIYIQRYRESDYTYLFCKFALPLGEGNYKFEALPDDTYVTFALKMPPLSGDVVGHGWKVGAVKDAGGYIISIYNKVPFEKVTKQPSFFKVTARNLNWDEVDFAGDLNPLYQNPIWV